MKLLHFQQVSLTHPHKRLYQQLCIAEEFAAIQAGQFVCFCLGLLPGGHYVFTPGGNATLICVSNPLHLLESVVWLVNGTASLSNHVESEHEEFPGARAEILRLINLPGYYNVTWITCVATLSGTVTNANASLLLQAQGLLVIL